MSKVKNRILVLINGGFLHILVGGTLTKMVNFLSGLIIIRFLTKNAYAYISYTDNLYSYLILFCGFGLHSAYLKFGECGERKENFKYIKFSVCFGMIFQLIVTSIFLVIIFNVKLDFPEALNLILLNCAYPLFYYLLQLGQSYLRVEKRNQEYAILGLVYAILVLGITALLVSPFSNIGVIISRYIAILIAVAYIVKKVFHDFCGISKIKLNKNQIKEYLCFSNAILIANLFSMIMPINENFLINHLIQNEWVTANYKVAALIPTQLQFISTTVVIYYFPLLAHMDKKKIWNQVKKIGILLFVIIFAICVVGMILTPWIIKFIYGDKYMDAVKLSTIMWIIYGINAGFRMFPLNVIPAIGNAKFNAVLSAISCVIHFGIDYILINKFGINGAIFASGIVYAISGICYWLYLKKICEDKKS